MSPVPILWSVSASSTTTSSSSRAQHGALSVSARSGAGTGGGGGGGHGHAGTVHGTSGVNLNHGYSGVVGSPFWLAPEVIEMAGTGVSSAVDIWALGCTVVELLTGKPPYYDLPAMSALFHIVADECVPLPDGISPALRDFLNDCFRKEPTFRKTATELMQHHWIMRHVTAAVPTFAVATTTATASATTTMLPAPAATVKPLLVGTAVGTDSTGSVPVSFVTPGGHIIVGDPLQAQTGTANTGAGLPLQPQPLPMVGAGTTGTCTFGSSGAGPFPYIVAGDASHTLLLTPTTGRTLLLPGTTAGVTICFEM